MHRTLLALFLLFAVSPAWSALQIDVTEGVSGALPIAIVPFRGNTGLQLDVAEVVDNDLASTGLFKTLPRGDMIEKPTSAAEVTYGNWRGVQVDNVVVGNIQSLSDGGYKLRFEILDVYKGGKIGGFELTARSGATLRYTAHKVADLIYEKLTGLKGVFTTRIAYVAAEGSGWRMRYQLVVADQDGFNPRVVVTSDDTIMSPSWSPDGRQLAYVAFRNGKVNIYVHELATGRARIVSSKPGINGAPTWSPDGNKLAVTLSHHGNPDIFILDINSKKTRQLTTSRAIDTEPAWSPDGSQIAFTSGRGGNPQVYVISVNGGNARRVTFEGKSNQRPSWSADGRQLTLVQSGQGGYRIAVMDVASGNMQIVSDGRLDESPGFAPNGQTIIYTRSAGRNSELATVSVDGRVKRRLHQRGDVREPAWSPFLK